ncbi:MAG: membrane associated rhomboid family serine protease [Arenicella sp.]|jgi:membrane associated rhomboid family serine protease
MIIVPVEKRVDWKRPPVVLILLVLVNVLVFAFYQSGDSSHLSSAVQSYQSRDLLDQEWAAYKAYARRTDPKRKLDKRDPATPWVIVSDAGFDRFIEKNHRHYISEKNYPRWRRARDRVEQSSSKMSAAAYGLNAAEIKPLQLLTYQFLHGGFMHILGNMVFLVLTGFAVEAALGSLRFLGFYLLSGIGSGLLYALFESSGGLLVGASGSISGVMAMYVVLFGMRKIQFFYWFFIFTGYVRAAAIIMLPFYIGFEIVQYYSNDGSNVAYTAHIGGFLVGAALVFLTQSLNKRGIDESYIEGPEGTPDPFAESITKLYSLIAQCDFKRAWGILKPLKSQYPNRPILIEIEFNLVRALHPRKLQEYLLHRMDKAGNNKALIFAQLDAWKNLGSEQRQKISFVKKSTLLQNLLDYDVLQGAEALFNELKLESDHDLEIAMLAQRLATYCQTIHNTEKMLLYRTLAGQFANTNAKLLGSEL